MRARVGGANVPGLIGLGEMMITLQNRVRQQPGMAMMLTLQNAMRPGPQQSMFRDSVKLEHSEQYPYSLSPSTASDGYGASEGELAWCFAWTFCAHRCQRFCTKFGLCDACCYFWRKRELYL